ncbi:MAG: hypothetical protein IJE14_05150 [Clostridia bacterium]|nr:hypothetical protein [Clostridia bacterium]
MMNYSFLSKPNLPDGKVVHAVVSPQYSRVVSAMNELDVVPVTVSSCENVLYPLRCHTDMLFAYCGNGRFSVEAGQASLLNELEKLGLVCLDDEVELKPEYPSDILLNCCFIGNFIICKSDNTPEFLKQGKTVIDVKQGYAKCSCIPVDDNSLITDDYSIYSAAINYGLDALLVKKDCIKLDGFDTGFIGGCCGKLSENMLAFCGDITKHTDYAQIDSFLRERNVYPHPLFGGELIDIGSILPVTQISKPHP